MDIIDFIFLICVWYGDNPHCIPELRTYILATKDIFYYKLKKKDKHMRINMLFYLIYVIIEKRVRNQQVDYDGVNYTFVRDDTMSSTSIDEGSLAHHEVSGTEARSNSKQSKQSRQSRQSGQRQKENSDVKDSDIEDKCQYLFVYTNIDDQLSYEMEKERDRRHMMSKLMRTSTKEVEIDTILMKDPRYDVFITKLNSGVA
jgi:hypothetical protein